MAMGFGSRPRRWALAFACASAFAPVVAGAQPASPAKDPGFLAEIGQWLDDQVSGATSVVTNFGREAGIAARTTADTARDAADALTRRIPATTVVSGHETCRIAPNGAPDCGAAADAICKAKGFTSGKSVDMTTAEICPAKVYMAGRSTGPDCRTETFVSSALCQ
jgi:hypothetical protein